MSPERHSTTNRSQPWSSSHSLSALQALCLPLQVDVSIYKPLVLSLYELNWYLLFCSMDQCAYFWAGKLDRRNRDVLQLCSHHGRNTPAGGGYDHQHMQYPPCSIRGGLYSLRWIHIFRSFPIFNLWGTYSPALPIHTIMTNVSLFPKSSNRTWSASNSQLTGSYFEDSVGFGNSLTVDKADFGINRIPSLPFSFLIYLS